jgi:hypothetical protein
MPGYVPQTIANQVMTGNNVVIMLGDQVVAFAQTIGHQIAFGTEQLYGVGTALPQEIQQLRVSPSFSLDSFELTTAGMQQLGSGTRLEYILAGNSFDMHVLDGAQNIVMYSYIGAKAQNVSQNIPANAPLRTTYAFLALDVLNAGGVSICNDGNNAAIVSETAALLASTVGLGIV